MVSITSAGLEIAAVSIGITLFSTVIRHFTIDKVKLKEQKEKIKEHQEKMNKALKENDKNAVSKHQQQMMDASMEQMRASFKPMLYTMIPILLIFSFMSANYGKIGALDNVTIKDTIPQAMVVKSSYIGENGTYIPGENKIEWKIKHMPTEATGVLNVTLITDGPIDYSPTKISLEYKTDNGTVGRYEMQSNKPDTQSHLFVEKTQPAADGGKVSYTISYQNRADWAVAEIFGYRLGWLGFYIVISIIPSIIFNKMLGTS